MLKHNHRRFSGQKTAEYTKYYLWTHQDSISKCVFFFKIVVTFAFGLNMLSHILIHGSLVFDILTSWHFWTIFFVSDYLYFTVSDIISTRMLTAKIFSMPFDDIDSPPICIAILTFASVQSYGAASCLRPYYAFCDVENSKES